MLQGGFFLLHLHFSPISMSPQDSQLIETRKYQLDEIARIFRIPPHMVGDLEKSSFNNIEQQGLEFVKYTLDPWVVRWEAALSKALLTREEKRKYEIRFNVDGLLRGDYKSRMEAMPWASTTVSCAPMTRAGWKTWI